ncbi:MAG: hypothetical protein RL328_2027 [Acidobacteriota bacterium]
MMRVLFALTIPALCLAQSTTATYRTDNLNGGRGSAGNIQKSNGDATERMQSINGRLVPLEQTSERILRDDADGKVVERTIKRYDSTGKLLETERVVAEESPVRNGSKTVKESVTLTDLSGRAREIERRTTQSQTSGNTTTTSIAVDRSNPNGAFQPAERRSIVTTGDDKKQESHEVVQMPDLNGRMRDAARTDSTTQVTGDRRVSNSTRFEPDATGKMALREQKVETTVKRPGGEVVETSLYAPNATAVMRSSMDSKVQIREQRIVERQVGADGTVKESESVRRPTADPDRLGPAQKISEVVCSGKCIPDGPKPEAPKPAAPKPEAAKPATTATAAATKGK